LTFKRKQNRTYLPAPNVEFDMTAPKKVPTAAEPVALDRRSDPDVRKKMSGPAMRTFFNLADRWQLCSLNSNLTGRPVFFCRTVARSAV
jgi:hypothetical protein